MSDVTGIFDGVTSFSLEEASGEVDGVAILAKIKGDNLLPFGMSRNGRWYGEGYRKTVKKDPTVTEKLEKRILYGTIGHHIPINDETLAEGKFSHIVTSLEENGAGEALVLNTPAGRLLNTYLRAKSKLSTSTRADGGFKGQYKGVPKIDEDSYKLESIDFVLSPGFVQAQPELAEAFKTSSSLCEDYKCVFGEDPKPLEESTPAAPPAKQPLTEEKPMTQELLQKVTEEKIALSARVQESLDENTRLVKENGALEARVKSLEESDKAAKEALAKAQESAPLIAKIQALGGLEKVEEAVKQAEEYAKIAKDFGTYEEMDTKVAKLGETLKAYTALGTPESIQEARETLAQYEALSDGDVAKLEKFITMAESFFANLKASQQAEAAAVLAKEIGVDEAKISALLAKGFSVEEAKEFFGGKPEGGKKEESGEPEGGKKEESFVDKFKKKVDESADDKDGEFPWGPESMGSRMMESMSR